ncbi:cytochrome P450 [Mycobacterium sp. CVI_P3]|uniref:Cytochrome P450 n=1 Tax=Mycobacterium pinniadriaticum TaxID=2994102 RepID=A0ABT3SHC6_9MYCO|nr:cytochrome P450 [Mycobacterium pinniadriaticum]MCX2932371.1 cytochrome P450 [Mycobacterium pinniadriaticum]MCX2938772.1 cytochrome P450 [Mycobacterium pinniadriaticum]
MTASTEEMDTRLNSLEFWAKPRTYRHEAFKWLRDNKPISWSEPPDSLDPNLQNAKGFWSIVKHAHLREVSRNVEVFSSAEGVFIDDFPQLETMLSFIVTDPPRHTEMRNIVTVAFTPRNIRKMTDKIAGIVRGIVDNAAPLGEGDLCELITKEVPGQVFCSMLGIIDKDQIQYTMDAAEQFACWNDPEYAHIGSPLMVFADASMKLATLANELVPERMKNPGDDLLSWVAQAQYEGNKLSQDEVGVFFALLAAGANDTTRHAMASALDLFQRHPDQLAYLMADFDGRVDDAVNEVLRMEPPLMHFRRTATRDYQLGDITFKAGDKVVMWYIASNRDEDVFENSMTMDISRDEKHNPHQSFGAGGPHYCLGHILGREVLKAQMREIYHRMPNLEVGEPDLLLSNFMNGTKRLPATWTPEKKKPS